MKLTIEDLRNPGSVSGFRHVGKSTGPKPYQAVARFKPGLNGSRAVGPRRKTAEESAQDYCDFVNNGGVAASPKLKTAGHTGRRSKINDPEVQHALGVLRDARAQREGKQGYVYCIAEPVEPGQNAPYFVKIGYSTNPKARVAELQTGNPRPLRLLGYFPGTEEDERRLHAKYARFNELQEWFRPPLALLSEFDPIKAEEVTA